MDTLMTYVKPELLVVAIVLYFLGIWLKALEKFKDKYIPFVLGLIGIVLTAVYVFSISTFGNSQDIAMAIFTTIVQGILLAALSTYVNQLIKQGSKEE